MPETTNSDGFSLAPGEQALVSVPSMGSPLSVLPDDAFDNLLVVSASSSPRKVESMVKRRGGNPNAVGVIPVTGSPSKYEGPLWTTDPVDPSDLTGISIRLSTAMEYVMSGGWVVFDNVNILLMYGQEEQVYRLLDSTAASVRERNACGAYCSVREAITDDTFTRLAGLFDTSVTVE